MWRSFSTRVNALGGLFLKELRQIRRNRQLMTALLVPPTLQVLLFGFGQNPEVRHVRLGVVDEAHTNASRELIQNMTNTQTFRLNRVVGSSASLADAMQRGTVQAGLIIPHHKVPQLLVDGSN